MILASRSDPAIVPQSWDSYVNQGYTGGFAYTYGDALAQLGIDVRQLAPTTTWLDLINSGQITIHDVVDPIGLGSDAWYAAHPDDPSLHSPAVEIYPVDESTFDPIEQTDVAAAIAPKASTSTAPAIYNVGGLYFDNAGNLYDSNLKSTGQTIPLAVVNSLLTTGSLPADTPSASSSSSSSSAITPPSTANVNVEVSDSAVLDALDQVNANGGDVTQPTALIDQTSGATVAVVQQLANGSVSVQPATSSTDLSSIVNTITGAISSASGWLTNAGTTVKKIANAVQGAEVGAQAGFNAPTDWKPILIGAAVVVGGLIVVPKLVSRR